MAVFIRNRRTGRLYGGYNRWVTESTRAFDFEIAPRAVHWINTVHLSEAEIVRSSGDRLRRITFKV